MAHEGARISGLREPIAGIDVILFESIKQMLADSMLTQARNCYDSGLELWRVLAAGWNGSSDLVLSSKARNYQYPRRCTTMAKLWDELPRWEAIGQDMAANGVDVHPVLRSQALEALVPESLLQTIVGRPELSNYDPKLRWVKTQIEHHRGTVIAQHASNPRALNSVESDEQNPAVWHLQSAMQRCHDTAEWQTWETINTALFAVKGNGKNNKGSGKGKANGKGG